MYKQAPGRMNMPKTGRGIPSALPMSPLNEKAFPIKPGMNLASFENILDKKTGKILSAEEQKSLLSSAPNTDLSQYEGVTNISKVISGPGDANVQGTGNISNRIAGPSGSRQRSADGFMFPKVNTNVNQNIFKNEAGEVTGFQFPMSKSNISRTKRTEAQLMKKVQDRNQRSGEYNTYQYQNQAGEFVGPKTRLSEVDSQQTRSKDGKDIYTTARITGQQDNVSIPSVSTAQGTVRVTPGRNTTSNLTQSNLNFPQAFTQQEISDKIQAKPGRFYSEGGSLTNKIGNIGVGKNTADRYDHLDFTGTMQAPNISSGSGTRMGHIINSQISNEARRRGKRKNEVRSLY
jgi:hypothetical protein